MSLGLGDLNKKKRPVNSRTQKKTENSAPSSSNTQNSEKKEKYPAGAWARSRTARPWTDNGLSRAATGRNRRRIDSSDLVMNEEWINLNTEPLFWLDLNRQSRIIAIQRQLVALETKIQETLEIPRRVLRTICKQLRS